MASLELRNQTYRVVFMYAGKKYGYSLDTGKPDVAAALRGGVEKTLMLIGQGALRVPDGGDVVNFVKNGGGQSAMLSVLDSPEYATYSPFSRAFADNYKWQKDVWHIPEFFPLLVQQQEQFDKAITGQVTAKQALDTIAAFQDKLLRDDGRIK